MGTGVGMGCVLSFGERMHLICADRTNASTVATVVAVREGIARIEEEVATVTGIARAERRRPVVAARALVAERSAVPVACGGQEYGLACIIVFAGERSAINAVASNADRCPCVGCIRQKIVELSTSRNAPCTV